ncbi:MAG: BrnT family toxin [Sideroxydans sp.]|nr:BrnT family toxin [Sideroxydans sp.]
MEIDFDPAKNAKNIAERGLDFARAGEVFTGVVATREDTRQNYGETRLISIGNLEGRTVVLVWTLRGAVRRIISMRYAHESETRKYAP